jgi:hypothetical protein
MALQLFKIASTTVESPVASVTFSSIPQGYTDLMVMVSTRGTRSANTDFMQIKFNGSSSSYTFRNLAQSGGTSGASSTATDIYVPINGNNSTASTFGNALFYIPNYTSSNYKSVSGDAVQESNGTAGTDFQMYLMAGLWSNTSAITQIDLTLLSGYGPNFVTNSTATLYGVL